MPSRLRRRGELAAPAASNLPNSVEILARDVDFRRTQRSRHLWLCITWPDRHSRGLQDPSICARGHLQQHRNRTAPRARPVGGRAFPGRWPRVAAGSCSTARKASVSLPSMSSTIRFSALVSAAWSSGVPEPWVALASDPTGRDRYWTRACMCRSSSRRPGFVPTASFAVSIFSSLAAMSATSLAPMLPASPFRVCASRIAPSTSPRAMASRMRAAASPCVSRKRTSNFATSFSLPPSRRRAPSRSIFTGGKGVASISPDPSRWPLPAGRLTQRVSAPNSSRTSMGLAT